jgi:hypothetical protein
LFNAAFRVVFALIGDVVLIVVDFGEVVKDGVWVGVGVCVLDFLFFGEYFGRMVFAVDPLLDTYVVK